MITNEMVLWLAVPAAMMSIFLVFVELLAHRRGGGSLRLGVRHGPSSTAWLGRRRPGFPARLTLHCVTPWNAPELAAGGDGRGRRTVPLLRYVVLTM